MRINKQNLYTRSNLCIVHTNASISLQQTKKEQRQKKL